MEKQLADHTFRLLMDFLMNADPWPISEECNQELVGLAVSESKARGFDSWTVAFHEFDR